MIYYVPIEEIAGLSGSGNQDTFKTLIAIIVPNSVFCEARILEVDFGPSLVTTVDEDFSCQIGRIASTDTAGTKASTIAVAAVPKKHTNLPNAHFTVGVNYSVEPTTFETHRIWSIGMNDRGGFFKRYAEKDAPEARQDEWLCVRIAAMAAVPSANKWTGTVTVETAF